MKVLIGIILSLIAQSITFLQLQGPLRYDWMRNHKLIVASFGVLVSYLYIYSVQYIASGFNGQLWPCRIIGFGLGVIVFTVMSYFMFNETVNLKTGICLALASLIILIQIIWK